jgi:membrane fusion protein (multidrug efflux system)
LAQPWPVVFGLHFRSLDMRYGPAADAPTHLGSDQLRLPPEWLSDDGEIVTSAPRSVQSPPTHLSFAHRAAPQRNAALPVRQPTERSDSRREVVRRKAAVVVDTPAPALNDKSVAAPVRANIVAAATPPSPQAPAAQPRLPSQPQIAGGIKAIDPLGVAVPPELGAPIYGWVRRLALQADLAGADRVLRDALLDLTSSLSVSIVYPGPDGLWSLGADEEIPRDAQPLIAVATARRAVVSSHTAIIPVVTSSETVAVVTLTRNPRNPTYHPIEQIAMIALIRESAAILHHLAVQHLQHASEIKADKGGLYRGEALEAHRSRGSEGVPVNLTPAWVKRTYPVLLLTLLTAIAIAVFMTVPTYSSGLGIVSLQGTSVTAPAMGTVDQILVQQGERVTKGQALVRMHSAAEDAELVLAETEYTNATIQYMIDQTDDQVKRALASASARVERARAGVDARVVRARKDGTVSDRRIQLGQALGVGDHVLTIVDPQTEPEVIAVLPGRDRPRLKAGQTLQVELGGYKKIREQATITSIGNEVVGGNEVARTLGAQQADSLELQGGSWVIVKARLPSRTFKTEHREYHYFHGMQLTAEVKVQSKPFLVSLLPALEKYFPD